MNSDKQAKKNLLMYPFGTIGRDMMYVIFNSYLLTYTMYTRDLTYAQLGAITAIMVAARIFDALNDPIMGNIIEMTKSKWGKFKPWLLAGILGTSLVIYVIFNSKLTGWAFIWEFGICYFLYSITYTMHDISYWGMIPALSSDGNERNTFTSRATLFAGIGSTLAQILIPMFTAGALTIGGSSSVAYGKIALIIALLGPLFILFPLLGVKEKYDLNANKTKRTFKDFIKPFLVNDQLVWIALILLIQQIGNSIVLNGIANNYIYFEFGYEGGLYGLFTTVGLSATAILMIIYPMLSRKFTRYQMAGAGTIIGIGGYAIQLIAGLLMASSMIKFYVITVGFMLANFGQYLLYLIMMISVINTVEYNELKTGERAEAIISSVRPFVTKMASAIVVIITTVTYMIINATNYTNQISNLEREASLGNIVEADKISKISEVINSVGLTQKTGLLLAMTTIPCVLMILSCLLYRKKYILTEDKYDEICKQLEEKRKENI